MKYACPCCGYKTLTNPYCGSYEICRICYWEDDGVQYDDPDFEGGANPMSLRQAQRNYQQIGACEEAMKPFVRQPAQDDEKDQQWLRID
jgi:Cysteine-rich CPCC